MPAGRAPSAILRARMAKPAPEYELVLMLDPEVGDDRRDQIAVEARRRIENGGGLKQERAWGLRKMAYEINQRTEADYRFFRFEKGGAVLDELNHNLKITDGVLRFRIFKVDPGAPVMDPPPPFSLAATAAPRSGGRRRDDDRPPRGPEPQQAAAPPPEAPAAEAPAPAVTEAPAEAAAEPEAPPAEAPAPDEAAESAPADEQS
jgi:small subunit ribosomal protein S6